MLTQLRWLLLSCLLWSSGGLPFAGLVAAESGEELFVRRVAPLLREKCLACHGADRNEIQGGLDLRDRVGLQAGGESGLPAVKAGDPAHSPLYLAVLRKDENWSAMPPKAAERLTDEQLGWIREWIVQGAVWPDAARIAEIVAEKDAVWSAEDGIQIATSGGLSADWTNRRYRPDSLWAYQPVRKPLLRGDPAAAIDELLSLRTPAGLAPAPAADPRTFIRRATFDLLGLPPDPAEVERFDADYQVDAERSVRELIDRLLASPHYGERMAQHWLDVVRYADSSGFANDYERGNAWRYRDYVVRAFNSDKPYDQFIREQLAGDEIDPDNPELLVATGFLRMGPWELTGMEVPKVARQRFLDDVTNSVGETFLAQALQCARCHDHKFDPVPTRDYYAVQAVFATTQLAERTARFLSEENLQGFAERHYLEQRKAEHERTLAELDEILLRNAEQWFADQGVDPADWRQAVAKARLEREQAPQRPFSDIFSRTRGLLQRAGVPEEAYPPKLVGFTPEQFGLERVARKGLERLRWELDRYEPVALAVYSGLTPDVKSVNAPLRLPADPLKTGELEQTCILTGGDPFSPGERVQPGGLSVLRHLSPEIPESITGRRLALANWIAHPENPLTARTIVNRIWMWHFGEPLAGNPNNFGTTGKPPTHPELLDLLAATFVEQGWSFKSLHRAILTSAAYRRSCQHPQPAQLKELDPYQTSYAVFRPRRLSAEEIRDAMLAASGELNRELGGIPNRPEINLEAALQPRQVMGTFASAWTPNPRPEQRHRRSLYALKPRGLVDPLLEVFNAPPADFSCERRDLSMVTPQVFALFNSQASYGRALAMAQRVQQEYPADSGEAITRCFQLSFGRRPTSAEMELCVAHWDRMERFHAETQIVFARQPESVTRLAVEENTGEQFQFEEALPANRDFIPDLQPADCSPRTRGLAEICLVLFNSNEFVYVE